MSNLLDRSSIVLTPTAYNNGEALCIKPDDGSGDFDFSRNSAATRVNAQGLVENVQILSSNLVQNGDFSDGENNWSFGGDWELVNGTAEILTSTNSFLIQSNVVDLSVKNYKLQYEVITTNGSNFRFAGGNSAFGTITLDSATIGVKTIYLTSNGTATNLQFNQNAFRGSIDNISVIEITTDTNLPRINYEGFSYDGSGNVVPDSGCGSWLFEPQSTNTVNNSNSTSAMGYHGGLIRSNDAAISPDSTFNAMSFIATATGGTHRTGYSSTAGLYSQNDIVTFSCFVKANGYNFVSVGGFFGQEKAVFNISNGTLVSQESNVINTKIVKLTNDWYRLSTTYTFQNSIGNGYLYAGIHLMETATSTSFTGDGVSGVYGYGFQAELGTGTSYIPTEGTSVTRNQDLCTNGGSLASINSTEGVLYAEIAALVNDLSQRYISINDGTNQNQIDIHYDVASNFISAFCRVSNSLVCNIGFATTDIKDFNKIAFKYKENDFSLWVNGTEVGTDTSGITFPIDTLNRLNFLKGSGGNFYGKTKAVALFPYLSDEELTELTTI